MIRKNLLFIAAFVLLVTAVSCSKDTAVDGIQLNKTALTLIVGDSETLTATITPDNATDKTLIWTSSATGVATVENGVIMAIAEGTATITVAAANSKTATCEVTVIRPLSIEFTFTGNAIAFRAMAKNIIVDWGDGLEEMYDNLNKTEVRHTYASHAEYTVQIRGKDLSYFYCDNWQLTALDVSGCTALTVLDCSDNQLSALNVSNNAALVDLRCSDNPLSTLDVSNNTALAVLDCSDNQLNTLDVSKNMALTMLDCSDNQLSTLDVSKNMALTVLDCSDNPLNTLDVSNNTALTKLYCYYNQLSALDVSNNTALIQLECYYNPLNALDVSNNTALVDLRCFNNQLSALDVSNNTALTVLWCDNNQLSALDVSNNTALTRLRCSYNRLSALDMSNNTALIYLGCLNNQLSTGALNSIFEDLPDRSGKSAGDITIFGNPGDATCNRNVATAKNWIFY